MIRAFKNEDLEDIMRIWLQGNLEAHDFIPASYWQENYEMVKAVLPQATVYVAEEEGVIRGFIGLTEGYIAGLFVESIFRSQGIGRSLLDHAKKYGLELSLSVYEKNKKAIDFYLREGFEKVQKQVDEQTHEIEYLMSYSQKR